MTCRASLCNRGAPALLGSRPVGIQAGKADPHTNAVSTNSQHIIVGKQRITYQSFIDTNTIRPEQINNP